MPTSDNARLHSVTLSCFGLKRVDRFLVALRLNLHLLGDGIEIRMDVPRVQTLGDHCRHRLEEHQVGNRGKQRSHLRHRNLVCLALGMHG